MRGVLSYINDNALVEDCLPYLEEMIDQCDAFILMDDGACEDERINAFLEKYEGSTPIFHIPRMLG